MKATQVSDEFQEFDPELMMRPRSRGDDWLISYSDLVTVLLCFFIMFFVIKAQEQEKEHQEVLKNQNVKQQVNINLAGELETAMFNQKMDLKKLDHHLTMHMKNTFFEPGTDVMSLDGKYTLSQLATIVFKYMPEVQMQLMIGSTGPSDDRLAIQRIGRVRNYLIELGLQQELMAVGTFPSKNVTYEEHTMNELKIFISKNKNTVEENED